MRLTAWSLGFGIAFNACILSHAHSDEQSEYVIALSEYFNTHKASRIAEMESKECYADTIEVPIISVESSKSYEAIKDIFSCSVYHSNLANSSINVWDVYDDKLNALEYLKIDFYKNDKTKNIFLISSTIIAFACDNSKLIAENLSNSDFNSNNEILENCDTDKYYRILGNADGKPISLEIGPLK